MKIGIPTNDKTTVSEHFGGSPYFMVITVEDNKVVDKEVREKPSHKDFATTETHPPLEKGRHGFGPQASERHKEMHEVIKDCDVLLSSRMGLGAYSDMVGFGMKVIVSDVEDIEKAISLYMDGKLSHREDRIC